MHAGRNLRASVASLVGGGLLILRLLRRPSPLLWLTRLGQARVVVPRQADVAIAVDIPASHPLRHVDALLDDLGDGIAHLLH